MPCIREHEAGLGAFWDTAVRKSSALQHALLRTLWDEVATINGEFAASLFLDIQKFYDNVPWIRLLEEGYTVQDSRCAH